MQRNAKVTEPLLNVSTIARNMWRGYVVQNVWGAYYGDFLFFVCSYWRTGLSKKHCSQLTLNASQHQSEVTIVFLTLISRYVLFAFFYLHKFASSQQMNTQLCFFFFFCCFLNFLFSKLTTGGHYSDHIN